jgi:hypothetical protein
MLLIVRHVPTAFHNGFNKNAPIEVRQWCIEQRTLIPYRERHSQKIKKLNSLKVFESK